MQQTKNSEHKSVKHGSNHVLALLHRYVQSIALALRGIPEGSEERMGHVTGRNSCRR